MAAVERYRNLEVGQVFSNGQGVAGSMGGNFLVHAIYPHLGVLGSAAGTLTNREIQTGSVAHSGGHPHWIPWNKLNWPRAEAGRLYRFGRAGSALYVGRPDGRLALATDLTNAEHFRDFEPGEFTIHE